MRASPRSRPDIGTFHRDGMPADECIRALRLSNKSPVLRRCMARPLDDSARRSRCSSDRTMPGVMGQRTAERPHLGTGPGARRSGRRAGADGPGTAIRDDLQLSGTSGGNRTADVGVRLAIRALERTSARAGHEFKLSFREQAGWLAGGPIQSERVRRIRVGGRRDGTSSASSSRAPTPRSWWRRIARWTRR